MIDSREAIAGVARKTAIIIGAGPAGLTAAYEFCQRSSIQPIVIEKSEYMGGISRTVNYRGNRIDIGGHRFFSKSDRVMNWWLNIMPIQAAPGTQQITYQKQTREIDIANNSGTADSVNSASICSTVGSADCRLCGRARVSSYSDTPMGLVTPRSAYSAMTWL